MGEADRDQVYHQVQELEFQEVVELVEMLRRRWASGGSHSATDREIVATLRRLIESDGDPSECGEQR